MKPFTNLFRSAQPVPSQYRSNFSHLYYDVVWFGLLNGSAVAFVSIYATRLGASGPQIGLLSAIPAIINLLFTLPAGRWFEKKEFSRDVFWTAVFSRAFYVTWIFLPWVLKPALQIWAIIAITLIMTIPGTYLAVGFNALFADTVPPEWRGHVVAVRNALLAMTTTLSALLCGWILIILKFPSGYQVVFAIGFLGAALSAYHLYFIRISRGGNQPKRTGKALGEVTAPGGYRAWIDGVRTGVRLQFFTRSAGKPFIRWDVLKGPFGKILGLVFFLHVSQYLPIPVFPIYTVNTLHFSDQIISVGNAFFNLMVFAGSTQIVRFSTRWGYQKITGLGVVAMGSYPALLALSFSPGMYLLTNVIGGVAWALVGGGLNNYLLERIPANDRPSHLAWYNLGLNAAILFGSLVGPLLGGQIGLLQALIAFGVLRVLSGLVILRFG